MTPQENAVAEALRILSRQADDCVTCLYAYLTIRAVAGKSKPVRDHINANALFWNTALHALQSALILALGRVFETALRNPASRSCRVSSVRCWSASA
jgi:AbiU2